MSTTKTNGKPADSAAPPADDLARSHVMRDYAAEVAARKAQNPSEMSGEGSAVLTEAEAAAEADAIEAAALAQAMADWDAEAQDEDDVIAATLANALTMKSFLPSPTFHIEVTLGKPAGTYTALGRIRGIVNGTRFVETPYGVSIGLLGLFYASAPLRGRDAVLNARQLFCKLLGKPMHDGLLSARKNDPAATLRLDCDVGVEATGKLPVSHSWACTHYLSGIASKAVRASLHAPRKLTASGKQLPAITRDGLPEVTS